MAFAESASRIEVSPSVLGQSNAQSALTALANSRESLLKPSAALVETVPRAFYSTGISNATALTSGTARIAAIPLVAGQTYSSATFENGTTALGSATHQWAALCDSSGNVVAVSADGTSGAWATNTPKTFTFSSPYTPSTSGMYYLALLVVATTPPTPLSLTGSSAALNTLTPILAGTVASLTTPPVVSSSIGTISAGSTVIYGYLS